jgi:hypothetical protein
MYRGKWYLATWFIALLMFFWFLIIPLVAAIVLLFKQIKENKRIQSQWAECGFGDVLVIRDAKDRLDERVAEVSAEHKKLISLLELKRKEIIIVDDEILFQSFGFYKPKYNLVSSDVYKARLDEMRSRQKELARSFKALSFYDAWTVNGSKSEGKKMNKDNMKLALYAFNTECDAAISKVKFNNVEQMKKRIDNAYEKINRLNERNRITITSAYLKLKYDEMSLAFEYERKREDEREEQRRIMEENREEQRVLREIEKAKEKIEKEETHFKNEIAKLKERLRSEHLNHIERLEIADQINELEAKLQLVERDKQDVYNREQNTRAGYVYIISNIGSFGEDVYKIGVSRRLDPYERVRELGSASVPFTFDVHAMIFSEDAPALETKLHKTFYDRRINKMNDRKEFFKVSLPEIEEIVKRNHNKTVEFTLLAQASEYRETVKHERRQAAPV